MAHISSPIAHGRDRNQFHLSFLIAGLVLPSSLRRDYNVLRTSETRTKKRVVCTKLLRDVSSSYSPHALDCGDKVVVACLVSTRSLLPGGKSDSRGILVSDGRFRITTFCPETVARNPPQPPYASA